MIFNDMYIAFTLLLKIVNADDVKGDQAIAMHEKAYAY